LDQNDTEALHSKIELLRKFIDRIVPSITNYDNVEEKYEEFVEKEKEHVIFEMSNNLEIGAMIIKEMISEYQFTSVMPNDLIRTNVKGKLLEKNKKMNMLREFICEVSEVY